MNLRKLFFFSAIALGLVACTNEDVPGASSDKDASISIKVYPSSKAPSLRSGGDLSGDIAAESVIKKLEAWVFNNGSLEKYASVDNALEIKDIEATSGPRTLVVVANANLGTQATLTALQALTKDLSQDITNGLVMTAEPVALTLIKGNNYYGYSGTTAEGENYIEQTPLALTRINARVAIVSAVLSLAGVGEGETPVFDALTDAQVAIFNVPKTSKLFGADLAMNADFLFGQAWPTTSSSYVEVINGGAVEATLLDETVTFPITTAAAPYYYVNENTSATAKEQMLIVLRAKPTLGGNPVSAQGLYTDVNGYTYYPVWVNATKDDYTYTGENTGTSKILRNTQYNISLTIKGIGNPSIDEPETAFLDVKVQVEPWKVISQNVIW